MSEQNRSAPSKDAPVRPQRPGGHRGPHSMAMPVEKAKDFKGTLKQLLKFLRPHTWMLVLVMVMTALSTLFTVLSPKVMGSATDVLYEGFVGILQGVPGAGIDFEALGRIILFLIALYVMSAGFNYVMHYAIAGVAQRIGYDLRKQVNLKLSRLPLRFFDSKTHGEILSRITNDVDNITSTTQQTISQSISSVVTFFGVFIMMLTIDVWLTLIVMVTLPMAGLVTTKVAQKSRKYFKEQSKVLGELNGHVEEMFTGHPVVKAYGREKASVERFSEINDRLYTAGWKAEFLSGLIWPMMGFISNIGYVLVSAVGGLFVTRGAIAVGDVQAMLLYARRFNQPIQQIAGIINVFQSTIASAERVFELLNQDEMVPDRTQDRMITQPKGHVKFEDVHFGYSKDVPLYQGLDLEVQPGQVIAIVGPTGAGKTTLVNLLMRFYEIDSGKISIDGVDIRDMSRAELRGMFGMVLQDTWLFNGTLRDNIAYGHPGATDEEIVAAAKAAYADHFIRTLPDGYDTVLNEEASNLSQGQKQLLTIARAFLADPAMLILDEATSSVDTRTEVQLQRAMERLMHGRTSFVIAHRLSTIREADRILVMNEGRLVEQGRHDELLAAGGFYADLYNSQFLGASGPASNGSAAVPQTSLPTGQPALGTS